MASYTKTVTTGKVVNTLHYRGHEFKEFWKKDGVLECGGSTIDTEANHLFEELEDEELFLIENIGVMTDYDLEEAIAVLTGYEEKYRIRKAEGGSSQEV